MVPLLIKGGRLIDPASGLDAIRDVRLRDGRICETGVDLAAGGEKVLDARNTVVAPGFIDMHVHLRQPGYPQKETIATGTLAAVRGGFTAVACMPNTNPALDEPATIEQLVRTVEREGYCNVYPIAAITQGRLGVEPCDYPALLRSGAVAFSDDGDTVEDGAVMREAALLLRALEAPFIAHCMPETAIVGRDLHVARETRKRWHFAHVSTEAALELIRDAKAEDARVTCEVTPHHLTFTEALFYERGAAAKVYPPLRSQQDVEALRRGVRAGTIDAFASDHAPHTPQEKEGDPQRAAPGFSGLEIAVGAYAAALPDLPLARFVELLSTNPARILGIAGGSLRIGDPADITIFAERDWVVDPSQFASKGKCTPFAGRWLPRKVLATIVAGNVRYRLPELRDAA